MLGPVLRFSDQLLSQVPMKLPIILFLVFFPVQSQTQPVPFALPSHPGAMMLDLTGFHITQASAKPGGTEIGIRAHDAEHTELLAFLFTTRESSTQNAAACLQADLAQIRKESVRALPTEQIDPDGTDTHEFASLFLAFPNGAQRLYKYAGSADQCLSIEIDADPGQRLDLGNARMLLARQHYDARYLPTSTDKYTYANILYRTGQYKAAIPAYQDFFATAPKSKDALIVRRVATDNLGMSLEITGGLDAARAIFLEAIRKDAVYPLYYYNLACADAEQGDAVNARIHLQQAFDRRENVNHGESIPNPATDTSILKLRDNHDFWNFVQTLR